MDRLLTVEGFNHKYIYISLLFPKLKKNVKEIDILELPHAKDKELLPSNDDGKAKSYFNIRVKDYQFLPGRKIKKSISRALSLFCVNRKLQNSGFYLNPVVFKGTILI